MCGIFGFIGTTKPDYHILYGLGILNEKGRGGDGWGFFHKHKVFKGNKTVGSEFRDKLELSEKINSRDFRFLGHARKASAGTAINEFNIHPHLAENDKHYTVLTHNGTLSNKSKLEEYVLKETLEKHTNYTDSWILTQILFQDRFKEDPYKVLLDYEGSATLAWADENPNHIYLYKGDATGSDERPIAYIKTESGIYYSSLKVDLEYIFGKEAEIKELEAGKVFKVSRDGTMEVLKEIGKKVKVYPMVNTYYGHYSNNKYDGVRSPLNNLPELYKEFVLAGGTTSKQLFPGANWEFFNFRYYINREFDNVDKAIAIPMTGLYHFDEVTKVATRVSFNSMLEYEKFIKDVKKNKDVSAYVKHPYLFLEKEGYLCFYKGYLSNIGYQETTYIELAQDDFYKNGDHIAVPWPYKKGEGYINYKHDEAANTLRVKTVFAENDTYSYPLIDIQLIVENGVIAFLYQSESNTYLVRKPDVTKLINKANNAQMIFTDYYGE